MRYVIIILSIMMIAGDAPRESCHFCGLDAKVHYFAIHLQQRITDRSFDRSAWGIDRLRAEVDGLHVSIDTEAPHEDVIKDAIDVAMAAMMVAHFYDRR